MAAAVANYTPRAERPGESFGCEVPDRETYATPILDFAAVAPIGHRADHEYRLISVLTSVLEDEHAWINRIAR